jgi:hypothetical protein
MGFRFRRSIRLLPGVRLNLSKGTPSISVGPRGFTTNIGKRGVRNTIGLPGSGLSYTTPTTGWRGAGAERGRSPVWLILLIAAAVLVLLVSSYR